MACEQPIPIYAPAGFAAWGVLCWFLWAREYVRDPRAAILKMARARVGRRERDRPNLVANEFRRQWRMRWIGYIAIFGYAVTTAGMLVQALYCLTVS